jgi:hypothetical protein
MATGPRPYDACMRILGVFLASESSTELAQLRIVSVQIQPSMRVFL